MAPFLGNFQIYYLHRGAFGRILFLNAVCGKTDFNRFTKDFGAIAIIKISGMNKKLLIFLIGFIVLAAASAFVFYFYKTPKSNSILPPVSDNFIQSAAQAPAVEGNIVNSGIAGRVVLLGGGSYEYEASLEIFSAKGGSAFGGKNSTPFISVRAHSDGTFQVPLRPGSYILKPTDPDGPIAPVRNSYPFTVGDGQWLQVKIEYK